MKTKELIGAFVLAGGWAAMLVSVALYLLFWRVDNEPGAKAVPALLWLAITFCSSGVFAFVGGHIYLLLQRAWLALILAWVLCIVLAVIAVNLAPIVLLLMV